MYLLFTDTDSLPLITSLATVSLTTINNEGRYNYNNLIMFSSHEIIVQHN